MPRREEYVEFVKVQNKTLEDKLFSSFHEISDALIERKKETEMVQNQIIQFREAILPEVIEEIENLQSQIRLFSLEEKQGIVTPSTPVVSSSSNCINCVLKETTTTATMTMIATKKEDQKEVINSSTMENEKPLENEVPVVK
jgi:hypothetical protein